MGIHDLKPGVFFAFKTPTTHKYHEIKAPTRWHCVTLQVQAFVQS